VLACNETVQPLGCAVAAGAYRNATATASKAMGTLFLVMCSSVSSFTALSSR
jgi:hypothetical protein